MELSTEEDTITLSQVFSTRWAPVLKRVINELDFQSFIAFTKVSSECRSLAFMYMRKWVHWKDTSSGKSALILASQQGEVEVIRLLLQLGANIHQRDKDRFTALHWASTNGHNAVVETLLKRSNGAKVNKQGKGEQTALHLAVANGHLDAVKTLLVHGADVQKEAKGRAALHIASQKGDRQMVRFLLLHKVCFGVNVNQRSTQNSTTPLHWAAMEGHSEVAETLLNYGADHEMKNHVGNTPLIMAARRGHTSVIKVLLFRHYRALKTKSSAKLTLPLFLASKYGHLSSVEALLAHGADPSMPYGKYKFTAVYGATTMGHLSVVQALLAHGANVHHVANDHVRLAPLHVAARYGWWEIAKSFLEHGADVNVLSKEKRTPLHYASREGHSDVVGVLLAHKACVDSEDKHKNTPLTMAASRGNIAVAELLIGAGADVNHENVDRATPFLMAVNDDEKDMKTFLLKHGAKLSFDENPNKRTRRWSV